MEQPDFSHPAQGFEQPTAEPAAYDRAELLESALDHVAASVITLDLDYTVTSWNKAAERLYGCTAGDALGQRVCELPGPRGAGMFFAGIFPLDGTGPIEHDHIHTPPGRPPCRLRTSIRLLRNAEGTAIGYACMSTEVPGRRAKNRLSPDPAPADPGKLADLENMEMQLHQKAEELARKNRLITDFYTSISHEFRTPLSIILMAGDLLESRLRLTEAHRGEARYVAMLRQNSLRLQRLIGNLLDITKIDAGLMPVYRTRVDIVPLLQELSALAAGFAAPMGISLAFHSDSLSFVMAMDSGKLQRILLNLLSNAIKHSHRGGSVLLTLKTAGGRAVLSVSDDGDGIPEDKKALLFDRFRQVNPSLTRESEGCGMGLALTKALVGLLGGFIRFESQAGQGSVFTVDLSDGGGESLSSLPIVDSLTLRRKVELEFADIQRIDPPERGLPIGD